MNIKKRLADWNRTIISKNRLYEKGELEERAEGEFFKGRRIIGRDTPINKGVYPGAGAREAIVVDRKYGEINNLANEAAEKATVNGRFDKTRVLKTVFDVVTKAMPIQDEKEVEKILKKYGVKPDDKIALDVFIKHRTGVCRHQALTAAAILEKLKEEGLIKGKVSVDRNTIPITINGKEYKAGHAWCRYTNSAGEVYIIDPAQGKLKKLKETDEKDWGYYRPTD